MLPAHPHSPQPCVRLNRCCCVAFFLLLTQTKYTLTDVFGCLPVRLTRSSEVDLTIHCAVRNLIHTGWYPGPGATESPCDGSNFVCGPPVPSSPFMNVTRLAVGDGGSVIPIKMQQVRSVSCRACSSSVCRRFFALIYNEKPGEGERNTFKNVV